MNGINHIAAISAPPNGKPRPITHTSLHYRYVEGFSLTSTIGYNMRTITYMTEGNWLATILGLGTIGVSIVAQVELWQRKEYRLDRMLSHIRSPQGNLLNYPLVLLAILLVGFGWLSFITGRIVIADYAGAIALLTFAVYHGDIILRRGLRRPQLTPKANAAIGGTLVAAVVYISLAFAPDSLVPLQFATMIFFVPALSAASVGLVNIPFAWRKQSIIRRAAALRRTRPHLTVVGITGSFGKTSTKHFLEHILRTAGLRAAATQAHHNTPIGVAQDMLTQLTPQLQTYVAELGAYRRGEIKQLAELTQPTIGVITAIGNQHLDLFGSIENILQAKWELVESLPASGTAVLNRDDARLVAAAASRANATLWYSCRTHADAWVENITIAPTTLTCRLHLKDFTQDVTLPLTSDALLGSVLAASLAAVAIGLEPSRIVATLASLPPFPRTMEQRIGRAGAAVIDDSYSANEAGAIKAIQHLQHFPQPDKRIVFLPLIELGPEAPEVHRRIGQAIRATGAKLFVFGTAFQSELGPGLYTDDPKHLTARVCEGITHNSVILLENRIPDIVRKAVIA